MNISQKYYFSDFTLDNYSSLLDIALQNYSFRFFTDELVKNSILLRHDVEFSIPIALKMAEIEAESGIKATYFVQLHSEFYNTLEKESILSFKRILELGHDIGIHFDTHFWNIETEHQLEDCLAIDTNSLERYIGINPKVFSFHNNNLFTLSCRKDTYQGLLNVYSDYFRNNYGYNADSLGYWRFERLEDRLSEAKENNLQILIHDGMWQDEVLPPRRRIFKVIDDRSAYLKELYDSYLEKYKHRNIDWNNVL